MGPNDWERLAQTAAQIAKAPLFIDDSPNMTLMEIRAKCRRLKQQHDLKPGGAGLPATDELGSQGRVPSAGGLRVLACAEAYWRRRLTFPSSPSRR
ncbi:hypothetical protein GCM10025876_20000 [Demequina litorisediminis]|uniref:SF4 helicase domain-containing protein n=1 Tax=Demequina litorisediminis TaxID=1849022 RepID=A0ABQ6IEE8_9MICO|nr:hypothetical protein GCM10025876_20000 [Demequina litorisediminis]